MVEVSAENPIVESIVVVVPKLEGDRYTKETVRVEYEWTPTRCNHCKIFDQKSEECPKNVTYKTVPVVIIDGEDFQQPKKKHQVKGVPLGKVYNYKTSHQLKDSKGVPVNKGSTRMIYVPKDKA